jgi:hypothetical protein
MNGVWEQRCTLAQLRKQQHFYLLIMICLHLRFASLLFCRGHFMYLDVSSSITILMYLTDSPRDCCHIWHLLPRQVHNVTIPSELPSEPGNSGSYKTISLIPKLYTESSETYPSPVTGSHPLAQTNPGEPHPGLLPITTSLNASGCWYCRPHRQHITQSRGKETTSPARLEQTLTSTG